MKKPTKLPPLELIEANFIYDPVTGFLYRSTGSKVNNNDRIGAPKIRVGHKSTTVARICWALYYRKDPSVHKKIEHINGDAFDNRISNLRAVRI
jgi:hypothetical protein